MSFPIRIASQLKEHLRALRKGRGLSQGQLGGLVGVKQARIAEIEANPGVVSLDQLVKVLGALDATLSLDPAEPQAGMAARAEPPKQAVTRRAATAKRNTANAKPPSASATPIVIAAKKGTW